MIRQGGEALAIYLRADCDAFGQHEREFANRISGQWERFVLDLVVNYWARLISAAQPHTG
jgi:hypothetical protein